MISNDIYKLVDGLYIGVYQHKLLNVTILKTILGVQCIPFYNVIFANSNKLIVIELSTRTLYKVGTVEIIYTDSYWCNINKAKDGSILNIMFMVK